MEFSVLNLSSSCIALVSIPVSKVVAAREPAHISSHNSKQRMTPLTWPLFIPLSTADRNLNITCFSFAVRLPLLSSCSLCRKLLPIISAFCGDGYCAVNISKISEYFVIHDPQ